ncbi:hypothetical protein ARTHRO9V_200181 [Arthrobacter sp. 9V]|nr:hypothetical protein [Arthrobacter sp. 9V]VXC06770.1 hypothetical protein ARTHRO9V_200181 [Arthrobacter sp. 9V]
MKDADGDHNANILENFNTDENGTVTIANTTPESKTPGPWS